jgi:para-nitrobenzyl esterase
VALSGSMLKANSQEYSRKLGSFVLEAAGLGPTEVDKLQEWTEKKLVKLSTHRAIEKAKSVSLKYVLMPEHVKDCYFFHLLN